MTVPGKDDVDALMAAITAEPVSEEALRDPAFAAEHAAAVADVALLRERLGAIGGALAGAPEAPPERVVPLRAPRTARRRFTVALGAVAAAVAAVTVIGGLGRLAVDAGTGPATRTLPTRRQWRPRSGAPAPGTPRPTSPPRASSRARGSSWRARSRRSTRCRAPRGTGSR
ncbi:hypothetical protein ACOBQB_22505 [Streptomyces sp. G5(2025)]|uniref:hypothetical protein n=1 Tax=Streptomyces sp. G5(2025) TaxID=3406628 RepID=UPI003C21FBF2